MTSTTDTGRAFPHRSRGDRPMQAAKARARVACVFVLTCWALALGAGSLLSALPVLAQTVPVGSDFQANSYTTGNQAFPGAAMDAAGNFVIVWDSFGQDGDDRGIFGQLFDSSGAPRGAEFQVNTYTTGAQYPAEAAMDPQGNFVVVWNSTEQDGDFRGIFAQLFDSTGAPRGDEFQVATATLSSQYFHDPAMAPDGTFVIAWNGLQLPTGYEIFARRFDSDGLPIDAQEFRVNNYTTGAQNFPRVDMNGSGEYLISWESEGQDGSLDGVFARRFDIASGPIDAEELQVNSHTVGAQRVPDSAIQENGDFVIAWQGDGEDGSSYGVVARRFDSTGTPLDPEEFLVNTYTTGWQNSPSIVVDGAGGFFITWEGGGFFARGFEEDGSPLDATQFPMTASSAGFHKLASGRGTQILSAWRDTSSRDGNGQGVFARLATCDQNGSGLCDRRDIVLTDPVNMDVLTCGDPAVNRPTFSWSPGNYDQFKVFMGSTPGFEKGTVVSSGDKAIRATSWEPSKKKWQRACQKALAATPFDPKLFILIQGKDLDLTKRDPLRISESDVVEVGAGF